VNFGYNAPKGVLKITDADETVKAARSATLPNAVFGGPEHQRSCHALFFEIFAIK
jgi:hypothetical protein